MHTLIVVAAGISLEIAFALLGHAWGGFPGARTALWSFVPVWGALSIANAWIGTTRAGYPLFEELPILVPVFGVPAAAALLLASVIAR